MRLLFTSLRTTSHFLPLVPLIEACARAGHAVAVAAPEDLRDRAESAGAGFFPVGHPGDAALRPLWAKAWEASPQQANRIIVGEVFAGIDAEVALPGTAQAIETFTPDMLVHESAEFAGALAAERAGVPHLRVRVTLSGLEPGTVQLVAEAVAPHRARLGLAPDPGGRRLREEPTLMYFPHRLDRQPYGAEGIEPAASLRFRPPSTPASQLPNHWGSRSGALVYATLGTVAGGNDAARAKYRTLLAAVADLEAPVLLTTGTQLDPATLGPLPANVHAERFVPQADVLPHAALVVCHGGTGTVVGSLAAGVPLVVTPLFADQPDNGRIVTECGAGLCVEGDRCTPETLHRAIERVLEERSFAEAAMSLRADFESLPAAQEAPAALEKLLRDWPVRPLA